jgi:hypothetical protein
VTPLVPLSTVARLRERATPTSISHQDAELATTISFNLAEGKTLDDATRAIKQAEADIGLPTNVRGAFAGTALAAQQSQGQQAMLIAAAIVVIYIVLGMLYESLVHPVTVLSTLPSAGVGAVLALLLFRMDFSIIALIGVFLLIGIVKKNAILIIDFALEAERTRGLSAVEAVREACLLRFRPILMTTLAAALGALPLAIGFGDGAELRRPLGVAIIGGLIASQVMTLLTTPVVYVVLDKLRRRKAAPVPPARTALASRGRHEALETSLLASALAACAVGPDYERPSAPVPAAYKEAPRTGDAVWLPAAPADTLARGDWWRLFGDAELDRLAAEVDAANQTVAAAVASYTQAQALVRETRAAYYPTVGIDASGRRFGGGNGSAGGTGTANAFAASLNGDWAPDFWGRVSRSVEGARAGEQGSAADLAAARLSAQGALAIDYFALREADFEAELLTRTIEGYERALQITQNRYAAGVVAKTDVLQAQTQLLTTRASLTTVRANRERFEHAIAVLTGKAPGDFALAPAPWSEPRSGDSARGAVGLARAPARHRFGRTPGGGRQRPDRRRAIGVLPQPDPERVGRHGGPAFRRPLQCREPALVGRPGGGADGVRRRRDRRARRCRRFGAPSRGGALSPDRPHRLPGRRGPAQQRARAGRAGGPAPAGFRCRRPDRAADPQSLSRRPAQLHRGRHRAGIGAVGAARAGPDRGESPGHRDHPDPGARRRLGRRRPGRDQELGARRQRALKRRAPPRPPRGKRGTP